MPHAQRERLLILGASVRAAAQSAARAGFHVLAADQFADRDLLEICPDAQPVAYPDGLLSFALAAPPSEWLFTGGLENHSSLVNEICRRHRMLGNNGPSNLYRARKPSFCSDFAEMCGFAHPETLHACPPDDRRWLIKRTHSSGGLGVRWAKPGEAPSQGEILQEWIAGTPGSAAFLSAIDGVHFLFATEQLSGASFLGAPEFHYAGNILAPPPDEAKLRRLGGELISFFGLIGLIGVDYIHRDGQLWLLEVNPRYTASMELWERAAGRSLIEHHVRACRCESTPSSSELALTTPPALAKGILYATSDGLLTDALADHLWERRAEFDLADLPSHGGPVHKGHPVLTIFAAGASHEEAMRQLEEKAAALRALGVP